MDVSIIIVSWDTCDILRDCLASIYEQTRNIAFEVIVVDNASKDGSPEMVNTEFPQAVLLANADNKGFAVANNQGIAIAKGYYVLLLNSDTVVLDRAIEKTMAFADAHSDAAVVGCRVLNADRSLQHSCSKLPALWDRILFAAGLVRLFPRNPTFARPVMSWWDHDCVREVEVISGCYMLVKKEAIDQVGGFDERFFMYCEEVDWCKRFREAGWKILFTPEAQIIHLGGGSAKKYSCRRVSIKDQATIRYMFKHWTGTQARLGVVSMVMFYVPRIIFCLPFRLVGRRKDELENHWAGLKGLLCYSRYLADKPSVGNDTDFSARSRSKHHVSA